MDIKGCFDINVCRNPSLQNDGDFCYAETGTWDFLTKQECCLPTCEDSDKVTCTWSETGMEYSGMIDMTRTGQKCVNWSRSLHKNDAFGAARQFGGWQYKPYIGYFLCFRITHSMKQLITAGILREMPVVPGVILHMQIAAEITVMYLKVMMGRKLV